MEYLFVLSRVIFGGYFILNGINHLKNSDALAGYAASKGTPSPKLAVLGSGLLILLGGLGILIGAYVVFAVIAIVLFLLPVSFMMHAYWKIDDPQMRAAEEINFKKNMALLGAALAYLFVPEPWMWSL